MYYLILYKSDLYKINYFYINIILLLFNINKFYDIKNILIMP